MTTRALVLAGGGIRVAWQTGALQALTEQGLTFDHGDATSGGIFTLGMLMSGLSTQQMGERWRALPVGRSFVTPLPWRSYVRSPTSWAALGEAGGVRDRVLPGLGIDVATIRRCSALTGAFNVADFTTKRCVPVPHTEVDEDLLVAGVSLAGVMPAVDAGGRSWTDAVWVQDANLLDAVRRGCDELWVLWCIGNTPRWGQGLLEQYVHMIELSATSSLTGELEQIAAINARRAGGEVVHGSTRPVVVHVVRPALPLPLDPDLVAGRIDAETLICQGYRDARSYLDGRLPTGVPLDHTPTQTPAREVGARWVVRVAGTIGPGAREARCHLVLEALDLQALVVGTTTALACSGAFVHPDHGHQLLQDATARLLGEGPSRVLQVRAAVRLGTARHELYVRTPLPTGWGLGPSTQDWELRDPSGTVVTGGGRLTPSARCRAVTSFEPTGAHDLRDRFRAVRLTRDVLRHGGPPEVGHG